MVAVAVVAGRRRQVVALDHRRVVDALLVVRAADSVGSGPPSGSRVVPPCGRRWRDTWRTCRPRWSEHRRLRVAHQPHPCAPWQLAQVATLSRPWRAAGRARWSRTPPPDRRAVGANFRISSASLWQRERPLIMPASGLAPEAGRGDRARGGLSGADGSPPWQSTQAKPRSRWTSVRPEGRAGAASRSVGRDRMTARQPSRPARACAAAPPSGERDQDECEHSPFRTAR